MQERSRGDKGSGDCSKLHLTTTEEDQEEEMTEVLALARVLLINKAHRSNLINQFLSINTSVTENTLDYISERDG